MRLIFMGTPDFSVKALEALIKSGHEVVAVYSQPPRPAGRGQKEQKSPVHLAAEKHNIVVKTPTSLKNPAEQNEFAAFGADVAVVAAYGLILPQAILDCCPCLNIHASILPRWRGAAPIQRAILAGDETSGVTIMRMDAGLDTGDMLLLQEVDIEAGMSAGALHDELSSVGATLIVKSLNDFDKLKPIKQNDNAATYAKKISKDEAKIIWDKTGAEIDRHIRAFNPYPGAYFEYDNNKIKIFEADFKPISGLKQTPGCIIDDKLSIACKDGAIVPIMVQRQGKKTMSTEELLRGFCIPKDALI